MSDKLDLAKKHALITTQSISIRTAPQKATAPFITGDFIIFRTANNFFINGKTKPVHCWVDSSGVIEPRDEPTRTVKPKACQC